MTEYQLLFNFQGGTEHRREQPPVRHRREAADKILALTSKPEIRGLIERGQLTPGHLLQACPLVTFFRKERACLSRFLDHCANGSVQRTQDYLETSQYRDAQAYQNAAITLRNDFDTLPDSDLALRLKELGFHESTTTFQGNFVEGHRVLLWKFRTAMENYEKQ
ncbi:MAG: hypothetical protein PHE68_04705 [Candidatus Peribacteraceae bacterium]|nr:hypothetical protein [Candidatus Peribacteraceae bacterium]MDD5075096.1 hypothetical protein [Candidatus Peribacteraceae bacterium]